MIAGRPLILEGSCPPLPTKCSRAQEVSRRRNLTKYKCGEAPQTAPFLLLTDIQCRLRSATMSRNAEITQVFRVLVADRKPDFGDSASGHSGPDVLLSSQARSPWCGHCVFTCGGVYASIAI